MGIISDNFKQSVRNSECNVRYIEQTIFNCKLHWNSLTKTIIKNCLLKRKYKAIEKIIKNNGTKVTLLSYNFYWKSFSNTTIENRSLKRKEKNSSTKLSTKSRGGRGFQSLFLIENQSLKWNLKIVHKNERVKQ